MAGFGVDVSSLGLSSLWSGGGEAGEGSGEVAASSGWFSADVRARIYSLELAGTHEASLIQAMGASEQQHDFNLALGGITDLTKKIASFKTNDMIRFTGKRDTARLNAWRTRINAMKEELTALVPTLVKVRQLVHILTDTVARYDAIPSQLSCTKLLPHLGMTGPLFSAFKEKAESQRNKVQVTLSKIETLETSMFTALKKAESEWNHANWVQGNNGEDAVLASGSDWTGEDLVTGPLAKMECGELGPPDALIEDLEGQFPTEELKRTLPTFEGMFVELAPTRENVEYVQKADELLIEITNSQALIQQAINDVKIAQGYIGVEEERKIDGTSTGKTQRETRELVTETLSKVEDDKIGGITVLNSLAKRADELFAIWQHDRLSEEDVKQIGLLSPELKAYALNIQERIDAVFDPDSDDDFGPKLAAHRDLLRARRSLAAKEISDLKTRLEAACPEPRGGGEG